MVLMNDMKFNNTYTHLIIEVKKSSGGAVSYNTVRNAHFKRLYEMRSVGGMWRCD